MTQVIELSGDEAKLLRSLQNVIDKQMQLERKLRDTADQGDAAGTAMEDALRKVNAEAEKTLVGLMRDLKSLGPDGAAAADALKGHLVEAGKAGFKSIDTILDQIKMIDPAAAAAAQSARDSLQVAAKESVDDFGETLAALRALGPEGSAAAAQIKSDMEAAAAATKGNFQQLLDKLAQLDPTAAESAASIRAEMERAANDTEARFRDVLKELQHLGPEGRDAAAEIKKHLVEAGKVSEKSIEQVVAELNKIDPAAGEAATAIVTNMRAAANNAESSWAGFGDGVIDQITGIALAYVGISQAINVVNSALADQRQRMEEIANINVSAAVGQQTAIKNLQSLDPSDRRELLNSVSSIMASTGVDSSDAITSALGSVASAGVTDVEKIKTIVTEAAKVDKFKPEEVANTAAAAASIMKKTGIDDARAAITLLQTAGTASAVDDPAKLRAALPRVLGVGVATVPNQDKAEAAREVAALWARTTEMGEDSMGSSSATFVIDLVARMDKFFSGIERERVEARSKIELIDRKIHKGKDTELDRVKKAELEAFLKQAEGVTDPGTIFGRLGLLQANKDLTAQFLGESGFGEKQFQGALKQLTTAGSQGATDLPVTKGQISADPAKFESTAQEMSTATHQLAVAEFKQGANAVMAASSLSANDVSATAQLQKDTAAVLKATRDEAWLSGAPQYLLDYFRVPGSPMFGESNAAMAAADVLQIIAGRRTELREGGLTPREEMKMNELASFEERVFKFVGDMVQAGSIDPKIAIREGRRIRDNGTASDPLVATNPELAAAFVRLADLLERVAVSNEAMVKPTEATAEAAQEQKQKLSQVKLNTSSSAAANTLSPSAIEALGKVEP